MQKGWCCMESLMGLALSRVENLDVLATDLEVWPSVVHQGCHERQTAGVDETSVVI
jgi:hypothetical protein